MKVIGIGGEPGTGKSSLMKSLIPFLGEGVDFKFKLIRGKKLLENNVLLLGVYEESVLFCGTDRLSMIAIVSIKEFVSFLLQNPRLNFVILFEGDRFFKKNFFDFLIQCGVDFELFVLTSSEEVLEKRRKERGENNHTPKFLKGRKTMYSNLISEFKDNLVVLENNTEEDLKNNLNLLLNKIKNFNDSNLSQEIKERNSELFRIVV